MTLFIILVILGIVAAQQPLRVSAKKDEAEMRAQQQGDPHAWISGDPSPTACGGSFAILVGFVIVAALISGVVK